MFLIGILLFAFVYLGMALSTDLYMIIGCFFLYGIYAAATEGISKAWISNICEKKDTATAIGTYSAFQSLFALLASSVAGLVWYGFGAQAVFLMSALGALLVFFYIALFVAKRPKMESLSQE